jgi:hypothetical protein
MRATVRSFGFQAIEFVNIFFNVKTLPNPLPAFPLEKRRLGAGFDRKSAARARIIEMREPQSTAAK